MDQKDSSQWKFHKKQQKFGLFLKLSAELLYGPEFQNEGKPLCTTASEAWNHLENMECDNRNGQMSSKRCLIKYNIGIDVDIPSKPFLYGLGLNASYFYKNLRKSLAEELKVSKNANWSLVDSVTWNEMRETTKSIIPKRGYTIKFYQLVGRCNGLNFVVHTNVIKRVTTPGTLLCKANEYLLMLAKQFIRDNTKSSGYTDYTVHLKPTGINFASRNEADELELELDVSYKDIIEPLQAKFNQTELRYRNVWNNYSKLVGCSPWKITSRYKENLASLKRMYMLESGKETQLYQLVGLCDSVHIYTDTVIVFVDGKETQIQNQNSDM